MRKCFTWKKPGTVHSAWRIQDPGPVQGQMEVLLLTHLSSFFGAMCCLSQSVENFFKLQREWSKAKVFWRLDVIWESFLNGNTMLSCLVTVLLVFHEILDALSNSTLRWFNWASVTVNYQILVSGISLQLYLSSALLDYSFLVRVEAFFAFSSMSYFCLHFLLLTLNSATLRKQVTKLVSFP